MQVNDVSVSFLLLVYIAVIVSLMAFTEVL
jgi:hypothetical protein